MPKNDHDVESLVACFRRALKMDFGRSSTPVEERMAGVAGEIYKESRSFLGQNPLPLSLDDESDLALRLALFNLATEAKPERGPYLDAEKLYAAAANKNIIKFGR